MLSQIHFALCFMVTLCVMDVRTELCDRLDLGGLDENSIHFPQFGSKFSVYFMMKYDQKFIPFNSTFNLLYFFLFKRVIL